MVDYKLISGVAKDEEMICSRVMIREYRVWRVSWSGDIRCHEAPEATGKFDFSTIPTYHGSPL